MLSKYAFTAVLVSASVSGFAQLNQFTLTDGSAVLEQTNLIGQRLSDLGGRGRLAANGVTSPLQHWWWYRAGQDTREYAVSNQTAGTLNGPDQAVITYDEPVTGFAGSALRMTFEYVLDEVSSSLTQVQIAFSIQNLTSTTIPVNFFSCLDADLAGTMSDDSATYGPDMEQFITDPSGTNLRYVASQRSFSGWQMGAFPTLLDSLTDDSATTLSNSGSPFGPGDYTGAFGWRVDITPGDIVFLGTVRLDLQAVPEPSSALLLGMLAAGFAAWRRRGP